MYLNSKYVVRVLHNLYYNSVCQNFLRNMTWAEGSKVLDNQSQFMNSPCGDPNKELNHKEENQK